METSVRWSRWAERHPALLDSLEDSAFTNLHLPDDLGLDEETLKIARRGLVRSNLEPRMAQATFADMIETSIGVVVDAVAEEFRAEVGPMPGGQFAVVACSRLGRRDVKVEGALEFLYLYDYQPDIAGGQNGSSTGMTPERYYDRLSTRCMESFRSLARENMLFGRVTAPNGMFSSTDPAVSLTDFQKRLPVGASFTDVLALAQARVIYGDTLIVHRFQQVKRDVLAEFRECVQSGGELASLRAGLAVPASTERVLLPRSIRGGLDDLDQLASCLKLMHGSTCDGLLDLDTRAVFERLSGEGLIAEESARDLADASSLLRNIEVMWLMTVRDREHDTELTKAMERAICLACEQESMSSLTKHARRAADRAAERIESLLAAA